MRKLKENSEIRPAVWVTSEKIDNSGETFGKWFYFDEYDSLFDMHDAMEEYLSEKDPDPELKYLDFTGLPSNLLYSGNELYDYSHYIYPEQFECAQYLSENPEDFESVEAFLEVFPTWGEDLYKDAYIGKFTSYYELGYYIMEQVYPEILGDWSYYFDFAKFGRDYALDLDKYNDHYFWREV